eukprot:CAMPEP_0194068990 /NCGR_PEP_ID=MMETSP0009_2-20130614/87396_1 /TAXON_ID=210454 /ORGANISM="Grammatophora oceanica, Strain CCMP 410" /LENGTH=419 /DNA_ID=CAMNT_0038722141 /DNA_START=917 /DNA_END=2176 /DNA_ORIENTATION=-
MDETYGGRILEANPPFAFQEQDDGSDLDYSKPAGQTRQLWKELHGETEPFFLAPPAESAPVEEKSKQPLLLLSGFDLLSSTERQAGFLWQVSGPCFDDLEFLNEGVENYARFLHLKPRCPVGTLLIPTYQIDLMWHTHILSSLALYDKDCTAILGSTFHHNDSFTDRSEGGILDTSFQKMKGIWKNVYGADYVVDGGMYRGEPPQVFLQPTWVASKEREEARIIGKVLEMGASSTSKKDIPWATPGGKTSDGKDAFIPKEVNYKTPLRTLAQREGYVLGRSKPTGFGYYHMETREAHKIIVLRIIKSEARLNSEIAQEKSCCGGRSEAVISKKEAELNELIDLRKEMHARGKAAKPGGTVGVKSQDAKTDRGDAYYHHDGTWLYPVYVWDSSGGACGGGAVCGAGACGGGACGGGGCGG